MKKLAVLLLTATLILNLAGCGNRGAGNEESTTGSGQQETVTDSTVESESGTQTEPGTEEESSQAPEDVQDGISEEMSAVRQAVVDALGENYWPNTLIPVDLLEDHGLTDDMYVDFWGEMPMIGTNVDMIIVIRAAEGQIDAVEKVLNSYREEKVSDTMQYPMNVGKIQASRVEVMGDWACFVQLGADVMDLMDVGDEEVIRHCQEQNEMALEAIERVIQQ